MAYGHFRNRCFIDVNAGHRVLLRALRTYEGRCIMRTVVVPGRGGGVPPTATPAIPALTTERDGGLVAVVSCPRAGSAVAGFDVRARATNIFADYGKYSIDSIEPGAMTAFYGSGKCRGAYGGVLRVGRFIDHGLVGMSAFARGVAVRMLRLIPLDAEAASAVFPLNHFPDYSPASNQADSHRAHATSQRLRSLPGQRTPFRQRQAQSRIKRSAALAA